MPRQLPPPGSGLVDVALPNTPMRRPTGGTGSGGGGGGQSPLRELMKVFDTLRYSVVSTINDTLPLNTGKIALLEPPVLRVYLQIRNSATSVGTLAIAFDNFPSSEALAMELLAPGESLTFDEFVPQNRVGVFALIGDCVFNVTYANAGG